jgi:hypothetical protein
MKKNTILRAMLFIMLLVATVALYKLITDPSLLWVIVGMVSFGWMMVFEWVNSDWAWKE